MLEKAPETHLFRHLISVEDLLNGLAPRHRQSLARIEHHSHFAPDTLVFDSHDQPDQIFVHRGGKLALFRNDRVEDLLSACPVGSGCIYGLVEALSGSDFKMSAKTITESDFDVIDRDEFLRFIKNEPELCFRLAELLSRMYQHALETIKSH